MKKSRTKTSNYSGLAIGVMASAILLSGCGAQNIETEPNEEASQTENSITEQPKKTEDAFALDFEKIKEEEPDAIARIKIPGTEVDSVVIQNDLYDYDYFLENEPDKVFIEYPNSTAFNDFNEIIYGIDQDTLLSYKDPEFFEEHRNIEVYIDGNYMVYEVVMARPWDRVDLLAWYAFPSPDQCTVFLRDMYDTRSLSDNVADSYEKMTYMDFLLTLVTKEPENPDKQFMVMARMIGERKGSIRHSYNQEPGLEDIGY